MQHPNFWNYSWLANKSPSLRFNEEIGLYLVTIREDKLIATYHQQYFTLAKPAEHPAPPPTSAATDLVSWIHSSV